MFDFKKSNNTKIDYKEIEYDVNSLDSKFKKKELELVKLEKRVSDARLSSQIEVDNLNKKLQYYKEGINDIENSYWCKLLNYSKDVFNSLGDMNYEIEIENIQKFRKDIIKESRVFNYTDSICVVKDDIFERIIFRGLSKEFELIKQSVLKNDIESYNSKIHSMLEFYSDMCEEKYFEIRDEFLDTYKKELNIYISSVKFNEENIKNKNEEIKQDKRRREIFSLRNKFTKEWTRTQNNKKAYIQKVSKEKDKNKKDFLKDKIKKIDLHIKYLEEKDKYIQYQENKIKSGYIYILSNKFSLGDTIFKICVTSTIFPFREINKLNFNSTPYEYEIECIYGIDDTNFLLKEISDNFKNRIIRKINNFEAFYNCSKDEINKFITKLGDNNNFIKIK